LQVRQGFVLDRVVSDFIFLCFFVGKKTQKKNYPYP
jgi:5'-3' exonuclease